MGEYLLSMQEALGSQPNKQTTLSMSMLNLAFLPNLPTCPHCKCYVLRIFLLQSKPVKQVSFSP